MRHLLVDHFTTTPTSPRAWFGVPEPQLQQRVDASVRQTTAVLRAQQVRHDVQVHNQMRSIRILPEGTSVLNEIARHWDAELDGLGLMICPLLFILHPGAYGAYSPPPDLVPGESLHSAELRWLEARTPRHAILLRSDAARGIAPDCFLLRHELDHARRAIAARRGKATVERANVTLNGEAVQQLFFGGRLEIEEVFVHADDIEATRRLLLQAGVRTYPGPGDLMDLTASLRDASPSPQALVGQMEMTARLGGAYAEKALGILPAVRDALRRGKEPVYTSHHATLWGSVEFNHPALGTTGELHLPSSADISSQAGLRAHDFGQGLAQLEATLRDTLQLHQWVLHTLSRFSDGVLESQRFGQFIDVAELPAPVFAAGYRSLAAGHFEARFREHA